MLQSTLYLVNNVSTDFVAKISHVTWLNNIKIH